MSWDDGKHAKVKRVQLTFDEVIRSIEVEYDGTSLNSQRRGIVGTKSQGFTLSPDEYITELNGYYRPVFSGDVITALTFKTNKATYGPYGNKTSNYFSLVAPGSNQIAGFRGSSNNALTSIDVHFAPVPSPVTTGGTTGGTTGTGSNTSGTGSTTTNTGTTGGSGTNTGGSGSNTSGTGTTTGGTGATTGGTGATTGGTGATTGGTGATTGGSGATIGGTGATTGGTGATTGGSGATTGGSGSNTGGTGATTGGSGSNTGGPGTNSGGSGANSGGTGSNTGSSPQKLEAQGGKGGNQWDDGADHDGVEKIDIVAAGLGIQQIRFYYVKNGKTKEGPAHGVRGRGRISTVSIKHPDEYLVSVEGWYDSSNVIQGIQFKTNQNTSDFFGYGFDGSGTRFSLQVNDKKIIGFHGFADSHVNSLGAYFVPISASSSTVTPPPKTPLANKVEALGGSHGETFDDGAFDHVRKVYVGQGDSGVAYVKFDYEKDGKKESREHGKMTLLGTEEFEVDSDDYITSVEVYVDKVYPFESEIVVALVFNTFKGKTSQPFGLAGGDKKHLKDDKGGKLTGFHGKTGDKVLYALGAYFTPTSTSSSTLTPPPKAPLANKVNALGGNHGETFDDGAFDHVRKVYVGQGDSGVVYIKFDYEKDGKKESREHGKMSLLGTEEFEVDSGDYITSVEVYFDKIYPFESEIVTALVFKTFKGKTSQPFGLAGGAKDELKDGKGGKLAGFHGKVDKVLYALGAYFTPQTN